MFFALLMLSLENYKPFCIQTKTHRLNLDHTRLTVPPVDDLHTAFANDSQDVSAMACRFKGGEQKIYDKEKQLAGKVKDGAHKAGQTAEHDYDR